MRIKLAWTKDTQALANNPDVIAVAEAIIIPGAFRAIAAILAMHQWLDQRQQLERALAAADIALPNQLQDASDDAALKASLERATELAEEITNSVRQLYANAHDQDDLTARRSKVIELALYNQISPLYAAAECLADCQVEPPTSGASRKLYQRIAGHEFDLCAWKDSEWQGEAYECGILPRNLAHLDCTALVTLRHAIETEYASEDDDTQVRFRVGLVSFDSRTTMMQRVKYLAEGSAKDVQDFSALKLYGRDNMDEVMDEL